MLQCWDDELPARWLNSSETISFNSWNSLTCCSIYLLTFLPSLGRATPLSCLYMLSNKAGVKWVGCQLVLFGQKKPQWIKNYCINDIHVPTCKIYIQWAELFVRKSAKMERQQSTGSMCILTHLQHISYLTPKKCHCGRVPSEDLVLGTRLCQWLLWCDFFFPQKTTAATLYWQSDLCPGWEIPQHSWKSCRRDWELCFSAPEASKSPIRHTASQIPQAHLMERWSSRRKWTKSNGAHGSFAVYKWYLEYSFTCTRFSFWM